MTRSKNSPAPGFAAPRAVLTALLTSALTAALIVTTRATLGATLGAARVAAAVAAVVAAGAAVPAPAAPSVTGATAAASTAGEFTTVALPAPTLDGVRSLEALLAARRSVRDFAPQPLALADAAQLLWAAQGTTRGGRGRTAPSAGALYPLELLLVAGRVDGLPSAAWRYDPAGHGLLRQRDGDLRAALAAAAAGQRWIAEAPAVIVVAAVPQRTARKYGPRAGRYVAIEAGHAAQNVQLQALARGLGSTYVGAVDGAAVLRLLGLPADWDVLGLLPVGRPR